MKRHHLRQKVHGSKQPYCVKELKMLIVSYGRTDTVFLCVQIID